jgi:hypothetical protein
LSKQQAVIPRFVQACQTDERVVAAFLGGSFAKGTADAYSDLDLYLVIKEEAYDNFFRERESFVRQLGEPLFLENFNAYGFDLLFFILADGTNGELGLGHESNFMHIHGGPHKVLVDKKGILEGVVFPWNELEPSTQTEKLRSLVNWFWHDLSQHFITSIARGHLWSAYGALEDLRRTCVNLARLQHDFSAEPEVYEKIEKVVPPEQLSPLQATLCPLEHDAMLRSALVIVKFFRDLAVPLCAAHSIPYPSELDQIISERLTKLRVSQ